MKQATLALLLALSLVVGLVGCGRKNNSNDTPGNNTPNSSMNNGGSTNNGSGNGNTNNGTANGGTNSDSNNATNNPSTNNGIDGEGMLQGRSFQEMLDDGRITDDDGYLENDHQSTRH